MSTDNESSHHADVTFPEVLAAIQARLGQRVKWSFEEQGQVRRTCQGILRPGLDGATEALPDETGRVAFRVAPNASWFLVDPQLVTDAWEQPDRRLLRVEMTSGAVFVIETLAPGE